MNEERQPVGSLCTLPFLPDQMAVNKEPGLDAHIAKVLERIGEVSLAMRRKQATDLSLLQLRILGFVKDHAEEQVGPIGGGTASEQAHASVRA